MNLQDVWYLCLNAFSTLAGRSTKSMQGANAPVLFDQLKRTTKVGIYISFFSLKKHSLFQVISKFLK